ncbi:ArsR/SmtB family transcription factor [Streptomyces sp. NBC_00344]|uniref:ArsR/SmtB family transcription factor n=1 Tax=Streptomyces sp. NBC_00344 TaxID=2975720 RepID=UPI002E2205DC
MEFSASDLARMRFSISPMWEVVTSYRLLRSARPAAVHLPWVEQVRPRLAAAELDRGWLAALIPPSGYLADFLNPVPAGHAPSLREELDAVRGSAAAEVRRDLDHLGRHLGRPASRIRSLHADPGGQLVELTAEIERYWEIALAPYWQRMRTVLDADIFHRARQVAEYGAGALFNGLHAKVSWDDNTLRLVRRPETLHRATKGAGLLLIPSVFAGPGVLTVVRDPEPLQLAYPSRGVGVLWERPAPSRSEAVSAVLGRSRTLLLTELQAPASTTELARRTGISPAGVSQFLTAMRDAGLVSAHRAGRSVLYARTSVADELLGTRPG